MAARKRRQKPDPHGRNKGRFVQIPHSLLDCAAFKYLSPRAWKLLTGIWRRHNGSNNGKISFSSREAMILLGCGTVQVTAAFRELEDAGFIICQCQSSFNTKSRRAREWWLTAEPRDGQPATREFLRATQKKHSARSKNRQCPERKL